MDLLNLDELTTLERYVTLRGERYAVCDRSVGQMIEAINITKKGGLQKEEEFLASMVNTVKSVIPDCPEGVIKSMSLRQMVALLEFANTDPAAIAKQAEEAAREAGKSGMVEDVVEDLVEPGKQ